MCGVTEVRNDLAVLYFPQEEKIKTIEESINCAVIFEAALSEAYMTEIETRRQIMLQGTSHPFTTALIYRLISLWALHFIITC